jgi:hypothetical protein
MKRRNYMKKVLTDKRGIRRLLVENPRRMRTEVPEGNWSKTLEV